MTQFAIHLTGVSKRFASKVVLDNVDMGVAVGAVYGFLGANGAGKTTTIRLLLGLLAADSGEVRVLEQDPSRHRNTPTARITTDETDAICCAARATGTSIETEIATPTMRPRLRWA